MRNRLRRAARPIARGLLLAAAIAACSKVPITQRRQFNLLPEGLMNSIGESTYAEMLGGVEVERGGENHEVLLRIGERIADASNENYDWEFKLIQDADTINAWALPGGKTAVYTGLLPVAESEAGLAFILGHEVGHATAHHGAERVSQQLAVLGGMAGLYLFLDDKTSLSSDQKAIVTAALGLGAYVGVVLPFSRSHEEEADVIGMMYMARAGYPPQESIKLWNRMEAATGGSSLPTWLSTHPSNDQRQANLKDWMARAKKRQARNPLSDDTTRTLWTSDGGGGGGGDSRGSSGDR